MKTIRYNTAAGWMLAALASVMIAGMTFAGEAGQARLTDSDAPAATSESQIVVRGSSDIRRRNARTTAALKQLFSDNESQPTARQPQSSGPIQQVSHNQVTPASHCCPADGCCPTCAAPAECCAPEACCPPNCCAPTGCCPPTKGCCPDQCDACAPATCACPADGCCPNACDACAAAGQVHISDGFALVGGYEACDTCDGSGYGYSNGGRHGKGRCRHGYGQGGCPVCNSGACANRNCFANFLGEQAAAHRARNRLASANLNAYLRCKLGYFIHDGNGGVGSPLFGHYSIVYPVDSGYSDSRDGQVYAAQGYGGAVSVPLAPTVRHTYNYGWGIPSSRLTPVSNTTP